MFEVSHTRKLIFAGSVLFFLLVVAPLLVSWWRRQDSTSPQEAREYYRSVGESLDRRSGGDRTTPVEMREEKGEYYTEVTRKLDRRTIEQSP